MGDALSKEDIQYLIARLLDNAKDAVEECDMNKNDAYCIGRKMAYYEMLDILKTELDVRDQNLKEFGLDINLDERFA